jgi:hypothetical protein
LFIVHIVFDLFFLKILVELLDFRFSLIHIHTILVYLPRRQPQTYAPTCARKKKWERESIFNTLLRIRSEKNVYVYSTTDDVFAWSKLVSNSLIQVRKRPDGIFFFFCQNYCLDLWSYFCLLSIIVMMMSAKSEWNTPFSFVYSFYVRHVTSRLSITIVTRYLYTNDIVRLWEYSQMTLVQNRQLWLSELFDRIDYPPLVSTFVTFFGVFTWDKSQKI